MKRYAIACAVALTGCYVGEELEDNEDQFEDGDGTDRASFDGPPPDIARCGARATQVTLSPNGGLTTPVDVSGHPAWVTFTEPARGETDNIIAGLVRLIDGVPKSGTINGAIHSIKLADVALALGCAHARGVNVNLVLDGRIKPDGALTKIGAFLKAHSTSFTVCNSAGGEGCNTTSDSAIMHAKVFTFSSTYAPDGTVRSNVSWFGSANLTRPTGMTTANNTLTTFEHPKLQNALDGYILLLASETPKPGKRLAIGDDANVDGVASPSSAPDNDIVRNRLDSITPTADCAIDVAEGLISGRPRVFEKLAALASKGCKVRVLGNDGYRMNGQEKVYNARREALRTLEAGGVKVRLGRVHDKLIIVDALVAGERRRLVYTGSHNLTASANKINDELFIGIRGPSTYDAYAKHFDRIWGDAPAKY